MLVSELLREGGGMKEVLAIFIVFIFFVWSCKDFKDEWDDICGGDAK